MPLSLQFADPVAAILAWLRQHPDVLAEFGDAGITGIMEAPWPHLVVAPGTGGNMREGRWLTTPEVLLTVYGDPDGSVSDAELWRKTMVAFQACVQAQDADPLPDQAIIAYVAPSGTVMQQPLTTGQLRYTFGLLVTVHPPAS